MHTVGYLAMPHRSAPKLVEAAISFDNKKISRFELIPFQFAFEQLDLVDLRQIQLSSGHIRYPQERILVESRSTFGLFLDATLYVRDLVESCPLPAGW